MRFDTNCGANQYVIYGAMGWVGRSCLDALHRLYPHIHQDKVLLVGSKKTTLHYGGRIFDVVTAKDGYEKIVGGSIFINSAFLRKEKLLTLTRDEYISRNNEISGFAKTVIQTRGLKCFINLSSGVARTIDSPHIDAVEDLYATQKRHWELEFSHTAGLRGIPFVNCRIFSLSGRHANELNLLAFPNFIKQALFEKQIRVRSANTCRTYIRADELCTFLLLLSLKEQNVFIDSGGVLINMLNLAKAVAEVLPGDIPISCEDGLSSPNYYGDYISFNQLYSSFGLTMSGIQEQVRDTLTSFGVTSPTALT